jgi:N-terminal domain of (some) glycogen debranching enzymes
MDNRLVRLRPRSDTIYMARNRTVLATAPDGFVHGEANHGLFVHRTRFLSRYRYLINGKPPNPVALSNLDQHSWLGYYIITSPGLRRGEDTRILGPAGVITQQTLELRSARIVGAAVLTIHFFREANGVSNYEVLSKEGTVHVVRQPSPWSLTANFGERVKDLLNSVLH